MSDPAASVILPVHNAARFVDQAVESVLAQEFGDFELLLLDDGSTDGSSERLRNFALRDSRCKVHSWPNRGLVASLNTGILLAKSEFLIRMDADDVCRKNRVRTQLDYLTTHPECVALGSRVLLIDEEGWPISEFGADALTHEAIDAAHLVGCGSVITHPASAIRKSAVLKAGGYRAEYEYAEDLDLFLRLAEIGRLANLSEVLLDYRQHVASIGYRHRQRQLGAAERAIDDAYLRRGLPLSISHATRGREEPAPTVAEIYRKWAWWALGAGNIKTARRYAFRSLLRKPVDIDSLRLCACVLRGY